MSDECIAGSGKNSTGESRNEVTTEIVEDAEDPLSTDRRARRFAQTYRLCLEGTGFSVAVYLIELSVYQITDLFLLFFIVALAMLAFFFYGVMSSTEEEAFRQLWIFSIIELVVFWWIVDRYLADDSLVEQSITATVVVSGFRYIDGKLRNY